MKVRHLVARRVLRAPPLRHLQVLSLRAGDVLVVRCEGRLPIEQAARGRAYVQRQITGHECMVVDDGMEIGAVRPATNIEAKAVQP